ncbi:MAG: hypothetical protein PHP50_07545 [Lachnospiraceae bacterium]|nr:hypothetical protein [Lachnospiraceae bacterium]
MAKKFGKFVFLTTVAGVAAATYYYLHNKDAAPASSEYEDDDFDDFTEDLDDEAVPQTARRSYVSLDLNSMEKKVEDTFNKVSEKVGPVMKQAGKKVEDTLGPVVMQAGKKVEDFFDDEDDPEILKDFDGDAEMDTPEENTPSEETTAPEAELPKE